MARYDRIARIEAPSREAAFPGWLVLRDLEGQERDPDLGRQARLRFLTIRCVRRLMDAGFQPADAESLGSQVARARKELRHLPEDGEERARVAECLDAVDACAPHRIVSALIELGDTIGAAGHTFGAEECYRSAVEVAERIEAKGETAPAVVGLARLFTLRGESEPAVAWGWRALEVLAPGDPTRGLVLLDMGAGFRRLGLRSTAEACYQMAERSAPAQAATVHLGLARGALLVGDVDDARALLKLAVDAARENGVESILAEAEDLLSMLEGHAEAALMEPPAVPSDGARSIAREIENMRAALATG
jgi:tetratricopeptide (TPR) repeat protein